MQRLSSRHVDVVVFPAVVGLTLATAYLHYWVGGTMLMLNAAGYVTLTILVTGSALFFRRGLPLLLAALAGYAAVTIVAWLLTGPYFDVAYLAKGIEIVLISIIAVRLWLTRAELLDSFRWGLSILSRTTR